MEGKDSTDGPPCLCRLDSSGDYILVSKTETIPTDNNFHIREMAASGTISRANHKAKNIFMQMSSVFFPVLHNDCCTCQGWKQWPSDDDPEHSIAANHVLQSVSPEIKKNRVSLQPPVIHLNLSKYKYTAAVEGDRFNSYYFLYIHAGNNFSLYVKAGLLNDHVTLLRCSSKDNTCDP